MKQRIITAFILIAVLLPIIIIGKVPFIITISLISLLGLKELINLINKDKHIPLTMNIISYVMVLLITLNNLLMTDDKFVLSHVIIVLTLISLITPIIFYDKNKYNISDALFLTGSVIFLGLSYNSFITVRNMGFVYFLILILIPIITDTFALFTGLLIGKHKLAPITSPKKTWEGFFGGIIVTTIMITSIYVVTFNYQGNIIYPCIIVMLLSVVAELGDLVFSSIKRYYGVKDYSNLIPGHGGILDRTDSLIFVLLTFSLFSSFLV